VREREHEREREPKCPKLAKRNGNRCDRPNGPSGKPWFRILGL
jgi:hypothetical protein